MSGGVSHPPPPLRGEIDGRFSHGKHGSCQRLVDEGNVLPSTLLHGLAKPIFKLKDGLALARYNPIRKAPSSIASLTNLCKALDITRAELDIALALPNAQRYERVLSVKKSDGSDREVYKPHYLIRKIQRRINHRIFSNPEVILWPDHIFGSIPNQVSPTGEEEGRDYISCARLHCEAKSALTIDIKDFFNNIHQSYVEEIFLKFLKYGKDVSKALADLCCYNSHVVQGALTSSYIASLCLFDIEGRVVERLTHKNLVYTRLVDDINVSSKVSDYDFSFAEKLIEDMLAEKGLPINEKKTRVQHISSQPLTIHGLRICFKEPRLPSDEVRRIRAAVKNVETLASERDYITTHAYRKDFNRCMGRVNKLSRVGHQQHKSLLSRLKRVFPLPSKKDIDRVSKLIEKLERDHPTKHTTYWYWRRFYLAHERLTIVHRSFPKTALSLRAKLKSLRPEYA
jgi:RNA-directed DNA polymerase